MKIPDFLFDVTFLISVPHADTFIAEITFLADHDKSILKLDLLKKKKTLGKKITRSKSSIKLSTTM